MIGESVCGVDGVFGACQCTAANDGTGSGNSPSDNTTGNDGGTTGEDETQPNPCQDADGDGFFNCIPDDFQLPDGGIPPVELDCHDGLWHVQPGGAEVARNGIDDNCNGQVDEVENGCGCLSGATQTPGALASSIGLCGDALIQASTQGQVRQRNSQPGYFGIAPRAGSCLAVLSSGQAVPSDHSAGQSTIHLVSNDTEATFECKVNEGGWAACDDEYQLPQFETGIQQVQFRALDASGNADPAPIVYQWDASTNQIIPGTPGGAVPTPLAPSLELVYPSDGEILADGTPYLAGYAAQDSVITVQITNQGNAYSFDLSTEVGMAGRWSIGEAAWSGQILLPGNYTLTGTSSDGGLLPTVNITVDENAETDTYTSAQITSVEQLGTNSASLFFAGEATATFECRANADAWAPCTSPHNFLNLEDAVHTLNVRALLDGAAEPGPDAALWQPPNPDLVLMTPAEGATTTESLIAFVGRGMPGYSVNLTLQQMNGTQVSAEWQQIVAIGPDGRFAAIFPPLVAAGDYLVRYSIPEMPEFEGVSSFTRTLNGSDNVAPGTFLGGDKNVQTGTDFFVTNDDPDPTPGGGLLGGDDSVYDLAQLSVEVKKPSNVEGFAFDFMFLSSEFPEFLCQIYNDTFYALVTTASMGAQPVNVSLDGEGNEITVNNAFFEPANAWTTPLQLTPFGAPSSFADVVPDRQRRYLGRYF